MKVFALVLACVAVSGAAHAQRQSAVSARTLMTACTAAHADTCDAYLDGYADAIEQEGREHAIACVPRSATGTEIRDVVVKWMRDNPQSQHDRAALVARSALSKAYPCKG